MKYGTCLLALAVAIAGCKVPGHQNLPPAQMLMHPGPGVEGPGPGVMMYQPIMPVPPQASQVWFSGPDGMQITWDVSAPGAFDSQPFICPGRQNFQEGAIYRLKLTNIPGRPGVELYPTLEVGPAMPRTQAFLAHNAIPVQFTQEDFDQVLSGNFVTKVIYLPDPAFQELALAGVETLVSTRLDPGVDPIVEADRRGAILAVVRLGNKDLQVPGGNGNAAGVTQAAFIRQTANGGPVPWQPPMVGGAGFGAGSYISGVSGPQYGMPMSGTPIGLPGPPHVPLGIPAGLQRHTIVNHTNVHLPQPTEHVRIDVKQEPGMSYPKPANHARIVEQTSPGGLLVRQPIGDKREVIRPDGTGAPCPQEAADGNGNGN